MELIHNKINKSIYDMELVVSKGIPFAKRNKDRRIRAILRDMRSMQNTPLLFKDIWLYFKIWLISLFSNG